ncbi:hypothetical protein Bbelb_181630 [Branchiostoma belcheri]|nr:hypothetical protein Bbelb_181630 [Branchiostoma belcheri]
MFLPDVQSSSPDRFGKQTTGALLFSAFSARLDRVSGTEGSGWIKPSFPVLPTELPKGVCGDTTGSHCQNKATNLFVLESSESDIPGAATLILSASTHRAGMGTTVKTERGEQVTTWNRTRVVRLAVTNAELSAWRSPTLTTTLKGRTTI